MASKFGGIAIDQPAPTPIQSRFGGIPVSAQQPDISPFPEERGETRAVQELPELGSGGLLSGEDIARAATITPALLATTNTQEIADILTTSFPNIGISQDPGGNLLATNNKTGAQVVLNQPGLSKLDILQGIGIASAFTPAARVAAIPASLAAKAVVGGVTAGATQTGIEAIQTALGGELDESEIAISSVLGGAAELVVPAIQAIRQARISRSVGAADQEIADVAETVRTATQAAEETGVPLFKAQQTGIPSELERQSFITQLPAGTQTATKALKSQNQAASDAVESLLTEIAPDDAIVVAAGKIRTASQNAIENVKRIRSEKASPLFTEAFTQKPDVDIAPVKELIKRISDDFPEGGEIAKSLARVSKLIADKKGTKPSLKVLQGAKLEIDQMLNKVGQDSLGNTTKRQLVDIKNSLLAQMDAASPTFRQARQVFEQASPPVSQLQESIIGKIADLDDTRLKTISRTIFDPAETNVQVIKNAKRIISDVDSDAWNSILRAELERRIGSVRVNLVEAGATIENVPGQLGRAIFGNTKQRNVLFNAVDGDIKKNLLFLETALKRASIGRPGGSQTAAREEIKRELRGGVGSSIRDFIRRPIDVTVGAGEDLVFNRRVRTLADVMFDPRWTPQLSKIRRLGTTSPAAGRAMAQLLKQATPESTQTTQQEPQ